MVFASGIARLRLLGALCVGLIAFAIVAQPAKADTRVVKGGESRLEVSLINFVKLLNDGIQITPIAPARLEFGSKPAAIFPVNNTGVADAVLSTAAVPHQGGLRLTKASINQTIDATNMTLSCLPVVGCRVLNTANNLLPNELAEIRDFTFSDPNKGELTVLGYAHVSAATALVLNTLFQTNVFEADMQLGTFSSKFTYNLPWPGL
jgi:hypothetical protein